MKRSTLTLPYLLAMLVLAGCFGGGGGEPAPPMRPSDIARDTMDAGLEAFGQHNFANASLLFERSYQEFRSYDDAAGMTAALMNRAEIDLLMGETVAAGRRLASARTLVDRDALAHFAARLSYMEARQAQQAGDAEAAGARLEAARAAAGSDDQLALMLDLLAADLALHADPATAEAQVATLLDRTEGRGDATAARVQRLRADLAIAQDQPAEALDALRAALADYQAAEYRPGIAATHETWAMLLRAQEDWAGVADHLTRAIAVRLWMSDRVHTASDLDTLAEANSALGQEERANAFRRVRDYLRGDSDVDWGRVRASLAGY